MQWHSWSFQKAVDHGCDVQKHAIETLARIAKVAGDEVFVTTSDFSLIADHYG